MLLSSVTAVLAQDEAALPDTEWSAQPKDYKPAWTAIGGADFTLDDGTLLPSSATKATTDFFAVSFRDQENGLAGGAECGDRNTPFSRIGEECDTPGGRVPVLYTYSAPVGQDARWDRTELPGGDVPGYVGAMAWVGTSGEAIAVGGDGAFPRRDANPSSPSTDPAGKGRAWLFSDGSWRELDVPPEMRGVNTVDCSQAQGARHCWLGGYQQLWEWNNGRFVRKVDNQPAAEGAEPGIDEPGDGLRFRVRQIRFLEGEAGIQALAVTSGCCDQTPTNNTPRLLIYDGTQWYSRLLINDSNLTRGGPATRGAVPRQSLPDSYYSLTPSRDPDTPDTTWLSVLATPGGTGSDPASPAAGIGDPGSRLIRARLAEPAARDSNPTGGDEVLQFIVGPTDPRGSRNDAGDLYNEALDPELAPLRLLSGDGDFAWAPNDDSARALGTQEPTQADGLVDWAVGATSSDGQGVAYTTLRRGTFVPNPFTCQASSTAPEAIANQCKPVSSADDLTGQTESESVIGMPTYALNSFTFTPDGAVGWAVGDKGALVRLGGQGGVSTGSAEPDAPNLGSKELGQGADSSAYDPFRPVGEAHESGSVPSIYSGPWDELTDPELVPAGTPNASRPASEAEEDVSSIVMSRDGSEGWALGPSTKIEGEDRTTLFHYDGSRWSRCDPFGAGTVLSPDPACASIRSIFEADNTIRLHLATRVPLERDSDPSNDDDFEVIALANPRQAAGTALRYREGRWSVDSEWTEELRALTGTNTFNGIGFVTPSDAWITASGQSAPLLLHLSDGQWIDCKADRAACGDEERRLPLETVGPDPFLRLVVAGSRIYVGGNRAPAASSDPVVSSSASAAGSIPMIVYRDPGEDWTAEDGGYDPGCETIDPSAGCVPEQSEEDPLRRGGALTSLSVVENDGRYTGWAVGKFRSSTVAVTADSKDAAREVGSQAATLRLEPDSGTWEPRAAGDAADDHLLTADAEGRPPRVLALPGDSGRALVTPAPDELSDHPPLEFDGERWKALRTPFTTRLKKANSQLDTAATVKAVAPDGRGGAWMAVRQRGLSLADSEENNPGAVTFFYHYTGTRPRPVFKDVQHPIRESITSAAGAPDGSMWVATSGGFVYRYDRLTGWDRLAIPGWDPGRIVTNPSPAYAIAVGPDGKGLVVGRRGRIAGLNPGRVQLDLAADAPRCGPGATGPCGTGRDLRSVAIAPDGSALVGGTARALLWRPPGGDFRPVSIPSTATNATFTGISMPEARRAWLSTSRGELFAGSLDGAEWSWRLENVNEHGEKLSLLSGRRHLAINEVAVDASGRGYAVGARGLVLERTGDGERPWRRVRSGVSHDLFSVALSVRGKGKGVLIGGQLGIVLTLSDGRFRLANVDDYWDGRVNARGTALAGRVVGLTQAPGVKDGQVEAWALMQGEPLNVEGRGPAPGTVLHYTNAPDEPLLNLSARAKPLPDVPDAKPILSFAAFGRSECHFRTSCPEPLGTNLFNDLISRRIVEELSRGAEQGRPPFAVFTGDVNRGAGRDNSSEQGTGGVSAGTNTPVDVDTMHRRWEELVAEPLEEAGVPLFGAIGGQDLSQVSACTTTDCAGTREIHGGAGELAFGGIGTSEPWRKAMADRAAGWGTADGEEKSGNLVFRPVNSGGIEAPGGGARTHYAVDVCSGSCSNKVIARLAVVDTSLRGLSVSNPNQNPVEEQQTWLEEVLASTPGGAQKVVISNTPTYSYGPGAGTDTQTDATAFETILMRHRVDAVVSGRLGWNGMYWSTAPGLHEPCPGESYPSMDRIQNPPAAGSQSCQGSADRVDAALEDADAAVDELAPLSDALEGLGAPAPPTPSKTVAELANEEQVATTIPYVVASTAGGRFGPDGQGSGTASEGYWHGYTVVHLYQGGVFAEQRPIFDWIGINAKEHTLRPGQRMTLRGYGREPVGTDTPARYDDINSAAITHRYDLVQADPDRPYLPKVDPQSTEPNNYVPVDPSVAKIDRESGVIRAGRGSSERTYAIGILSVGDKVATWPVVFEPRKNRVATKTTVTLPPRPPQAPAIRVAAAPPTSPPPAPPIAPTVGNITFPSPPTPAPPPPVGTTPPPPPPPAPPPPPPPPGQFGQALPLSLSPKLTPVSFSGTVVPPTPPPVNPAPPSGSAAKKEARQRQAAAAKSEEGSGDEGVNPGDAQGRVNTVDSPSQSATRLDQDRLAFTRAEHAEQPSAWSRGALYGGALVGTAVVLALGFSILRPTPRRREPRLPAPAYSRTWQRRR